MDYLRKETGKVLRLDHTYKFTKTLGGYSTKAKKWVKVIVTLYNLLIADSNSCLTSIGA